MILELSRKNRSYRAFDETKPLTRQQLAALVEPTRFCPSSVNMQPMKYYLSCTPEQNGRIFPLTRWARLLKDYDGPAEGQRPTGYIIVCVDENILPNTDRAKTDVGIVAQTIMLAAVEQGLGGCMIANFDKDALKAAISLPEKMFPALILALGVPAEEIILEEIADGESTKYYRDAEGRHHVPKRRLEDILL